MEAQQVDDRVLDVVGATRDRAILDVGMAAGPPPPSSAQRVALVAPGQRRDRLGHGGREQQRPARGGRRVEDELEILPEPHVEHLVGLVEHRASRAEARGAALEMVAQPPGRADDDVGAGAQRARSARGVHAADAGDDAGARLLVEPDQLAAAPGARVRASARRPGRAGRRRWRKRPRPPPSACRRCRGRRQRSCPSRSAPTRRGRGRRSRARGPPPAQGSARGSCVRRAHGRWAREARETAREWRPSGGTVSALVGDIARRRHGRPLRQARRRNPKATSPAIVVIRIAAVSAAAWRPPVTALPA